VNDESDPLRAVAGLSAAELQDVLAMLAGTDITELDVSLGPARLSLRRPASRHVTAPTESPAEALSMAVASPLVGVFHSSVKVGDAVSHGQLIGAVESLGMPTNVDAPESGTVEDVLVADGAPVEYGQALLVLRRGG
jgi:acetyl-CoA carboxylase biotin carboxyl carrier protein